MRLSRILPVLLALLAASPNGAGAQGWKDRLKQRVEKKVADRVEKKTDEATDRALDKAEDAVRCAVGDSACIDRAKREGKRVITGGESAAPGSGVWATYDWAPGDRLLFFEDFSSDRIGDFPQRIEPGGGSFEVVEESGRHLLHNTKPAEFRIVLPETLPQRFTVDFDMRVPTSNARPVEVRVIDPGDQSSAALRAQTRAFCGAIGSGFGTMDGEMRIVTPINHGETEWMHCAIAADGERMTMHVGTQRVASAPRTNFGRGTTLSVMVPAEPGYESLISNIRVTGGEPLSYDALATNGRVAVLGIVFDEGSDRLRGESTPTLRAIGEMLKAHPSLQLTIEGHTDDAGDAAQNQALSERRAKAVRQWLVSSYGIAGTRLDAHGFGATRPVDTNATAEGRLRNRRMELVRR